MRRAARFSASTGRERRQARTHASAAEPMAAARRMIALTTMARRCSVRAASNPLRHGFAGALRLGGDRILHGDEPGRDDLQRRRLAGRRGLAPHAPLHPRARRAVPGAQRLAERDGAAHVDGRARRRGEAREQVLLQRVGRLERARVPLRRGVLELPLHPREAASRSWNSWSVGNSRTSTRRSSSAADEESRQETAVASSVATAATSEGKQDLLTERQGERAHGRGGG